MAQCFNIYFPKYYFVKQKEFTLSLPYPLPFEYTVAGNKAYVTDIDWNDKTYSEQSKEKWKRKGLQEGLTIIAINNETLPSVTSMTVHRKSIDDQDQEQTDMLTITKLRNIIENEIMNIDDDSTDNKDQKKKKKKHKDTDTVRLKISITFREEISSSDDSVPLGLTYNNIKVTNDYNTDDDDDDDDNDSDIDEKIHAYGRDKFDNTKFNKMMGGTIYQYTSDITSEQISASSCSDKHEPIQCKLNNPSSYWKPSLKNQLLRNVWIKFDLNAKKLISKIQIQGSTDHQSYIKSLWIDYSNDDCVWKSHPMRRIECKYAVPDGRTKCGSGGGGGSGSGSGMLVDDNSNANQDLSLYDQMSSNYLNKEQQYPTCEIHIWPEIDAEFVRIRPSTWCNDCALRIELFGPLKKQAEFAKVVTINTVNKCDKSDLMSVLKNKSTNDKVMQIDCKSLVRFALDNAQITKYSMIPISDVNDNHNDYLCTFTTNNANASEIAMNTLEENGIGHDFGIVSITSIIYRHAPKTKLETDIEKEKEKSDPTGFYHSIKSRMVVKQVVDDTMNGAAFTFDYVMMLTAASLIAVGGLATNNAVIIVASMLVSPLMGPVLAFTFGITLHNRQMWQIGLQNEIISLFICIGYGFVVGYFYALFSQNRNHWPTQQMSSRGTIVGLADGAFIAAASGIGVALSVLGNYVPTVIGVAISASLLPPAVNSGMLLSFPLYQMTHPEYTNRLEDPEYDAKEILFMSMISLALTIENVIIIFLVARFMFAIKNVVAKTFDEASVWNSIHNFKDKKRTHLGGSSSRSSSMFSTTGNAVAGAIMRGNTMYNGIISNDDINTDPDPQLNLINTNTAQIDSILHQTIMKNRNNDDDDDDNDNDQITELTNIINIKTNNSKKYNKTIPSETEDDTELDDDDQKQQEQMPLTTVNEK